ATPHPLGAAGEPRFARGRSVPAITHRSGGPIQGGQGPIGGGFRAAVPHRAPQAHGGQYFAGSPTGRSGPHVRPYTDSPAGHSQPQGLTVRPPPRGRSLTA